LSVICMICLITPSVFGLVPVPFSVCGNPATQHLKISSVQSSVWPPALGAPITVAFAGALDEDINGAGTFAVDVSFDGLPIYSKTGSLSELFNKVNITVIPAGPINITQTINVPSLPISGTIAVSLSAADDHAQPITCVKLSAKIGGVNTPSHIHRLQTLITNTQQQVVAADALNKVFSAIF